MSGDTQTLSNNTHRTVENAYKLSEDTSDGYYLQPKQLTANSVTRSDESGIGSLSGNSGNVNPAFLSSPESEFETSFCADGRSPYSPIDSQAMDLIWGLMSWICHLPQHQISCGLCQTMHSKKQRCL
ncbi:hypothetical protein EB796_006889 [Bugula neritina]|uniref:Uncharacterized protein n=1 Tax=Bugula neritina TaxID=10212 RepID=A0A7J7KAD2_BUGNE|nr:hypothetical protein EB796_006889 [Bugula neritina]